LPGGPPIAAEVTMGGSAGKEGCGAACPSRRTVTRRFWYPSSSPKPKEVPAMSAEIMTIKELAQYLDLTEATLYKKVSNHEIPYAKLGNLLRFPKWAIDRWIGENTVQPPDALFDEFARLQSRYHFKKWLESKGVDPTALTDAQLLELAKKAIADLAAGEPQP